MGRSHAFSHHLAALSLALLIISMAPRALASSTPFTVAWTAPGDDGGNGTATSYDMRYSLTPLTDANFALATRILGLPAPAPAGTQQSFVITGLTDDVPYYIAIRTADEVGNWSAISNVYMRPVMQSITGAQPLTLQFSSPWPNPAHDAVHWDITMPVTADLEVDVFDLAGRHVQTVSRGLHPAGVGQLTWNLRGKLGARVENGVYFVRARIGSRQWAGRLVVA